MVRRTLDHKSNHGEMSEIVKRTIDHKSKSSLGPVHAGALPPAGQNPQFLNFLGNKKRDFSRVFEPWAECSLFGVHLKKTRTEK